MPDLIGQSIGRYHILEQLGEGGMAVVYKAYDTRLDTNVAIKFIRRESFGSEEMGRIHQRFEREAHTLAKMTHTHIIQIMDYGEYEGSPYLVMPFIPGGSLKELIHGPMPPHQAARLLTPVARALHYAHGLGIIHRDIKPANILITAAGDPMLGDFGIARIISSEDMTNLTVTGFGVGTPNYMSPEQCLGKAEAQSDQYALGVVFYEMVTGRLPYQADTPPAVMIKQINDPLPRQRDFVPDLPDEVERVLFKALAKDPRERYPDTGAFAMALERLAASQPQPVEPPAQMAATSDAAPIPSQPAFQVTYRDAVPSNAGVPAGYESLPGAPAAVQQARQRKWIGGAIAGGVGLLGLFCVIGVGAFFLLRGQGQANQTATAEAQAQNPPPESSAEPGTALAESTAIPFEPTATPIVLTAVPTSTPTEFPTLISGAEMVSPKDGMVMVYVPVGEFRMGSTSSDANAEEDEFPQHTVSLDAYWIDQTEVTNAMFAEFVSQTGYISSAEKPGDTGGGVVDPASGDRTNTLGANWQHPHGPGSTRNGLNDHPVVQVSWLDAAAYCEWAGRRLPSEAEWEKAARGSDGRLYPWGSQTAGNAQVNDSGSGDGWLQTAPVGSFPAGASPYGALDMAGNAWEWTADWYDEGYYTTSPAVNPAGAASGEQRVFKGGGWSNTGRRYRPANRGYTPVTDHSDDIGFRCAMSAAGP